MFALRRTTARATTGVRAVNKPSPFSTASPRRVAKDAHEAAHQDHASHHSPPQDEKIGTQLYVVLGVMVSSWAVYKISRPSEDGKLPGFGRFINSYHHIQEKFAARNKLHTSMVEQAAFDRNLFQSDTKTAHVNLRFPETFNTGSPYNGQAGHSTRNMDVLVAHYEDLNKETGAQQL